MLPCFYSAVHALMTVPHKRDEALLQSAVHTLMTGLCKRDETLLQTAVHPLITVYPHLHSSHILAVVSHAAFLQA